jgi:hypothetical protein
MAHRFSVNEVAANIEISRLTSDLNAAIARIYDHFGEEFSEASRLAMRASLAASPRGGYGRNRYRLADFGINPDRLRPYFTPYIEYFGVKPRAAPEGSVGV